MKTIKYINLTNGVEAIPGISGDYHFIRIQSTACEQKLWGKILDELDYDLLLNLALGNNCIIYDYSQKKDIPRAVYQGVPWIRFVLGKVWFDMTDPVTVREQDCLSYFEEEYRKMKDSYTIERLKWFRKFLNTSHLWLSTITAQTSHDNDYKYYRDVLYKYHCEASTSGTCEGTAT